MFVAGSGLRPSPSDFPGGGASCHRRILFRLHHRALWDGGGAAPQGHYVGEEDDGPAELGAYLTLGPTALLRHVPA
jgi:hypothetical protein